MNLLKTRARACLVAGVAAIAIGVGSTGMYVGAQTPPASSSSLEFVPVSPDRVLDSRNGIGRSTKFGSGDEQVLTLAGRRKVPTNAQAVAINLTSTRVDAYGWVALWPNGESQPATSAANLQIGEDVANSGIFGLGRDGALRIHVFGGPTDLIVDVTGYFVPATGSHGGGVSGGTSNPTGACAPGSVFHNLVSGDTFACTDGGTWTAVGNLRGPAGSLGASGAQGPAGPAGDEGPQGPQGPAGTAATVSTTPGTPTDPGSAEGDLAIDETTGDIYRWDGTTWVVVANTASPRVSGSVSNSANDLDVVLLGVLADPGNDTVVGSVTGLPAGSYDATATVDVAIAGGGLISAGAGVQVRCWWSNTPELVYTTSLSVGIVVLGIGIAGLSTGSITVPGTLAGDTDLVCDSGGTLSVNAGVDVRSVHISAVRVGNTPVGTVALPAAP